MEDNKVALKRKGIENNRIIATLKDVKSLFGILIGSIVCMNTKDDPMKESLEDGEPVPSVNKIDFDNPQWYGSFEIVGLKCIRPDNKVYENVETFIRNKGNHVDEILIPIENLPIDVLAELAVDLSDTFGCGDAIEEVFSENIEGII